MFHITYRTVYCTTTVCTSSLNDHFHHRHHSKAALTRLDVRSFKSCFHTSSFWCKLLPFFLFPFSRLSGPGSAVEALVLGSKCSCGVSPHGESESSNFPLCLCCRNRKPQLSFSLWSAEPDSFSSVIAAEASECPCHGIKPSCGLAGDVDASSRRPES